MQSNVIYTVCRAGLDWIWTGSGCVLEWIPIEVRLDLGWNWAVAVLMVYWIYIVPHRCISIASDMALDWIWLGLALHANCTVGVSRLDPE